MLVVGRVVGKAVVGGLEEVVGGVELHYLPRRRVYGKIPEAAVVGGGEIQGGGIKKGVV